MDDLLHSRGSLATGLGEPEPIHYRSSGFVNRSWANDRLLAGAANRCRKLFLVNFVCRVLELTA